MVARRMMPVRPLPPTVAQNSSAFAAPSGVSVRTWPSAVSRSIERDVVAEAARAVVVLAVDVAGDRAADGDLPGARQHRNPQAERQRGRISWSRLTPASTSTECGVGVDRVDPVAARSCR